MSYVDKRFLRPLGGVAVLVDRQCSGHGNVETTRRNELPSNGPRRVPATFRLRPRYTSPNRSV